MSKKYTLVEFKEKYNNKLNKTIEIIGEYKSRNEQIECRCLICNDLFFTTPAVLALGCGHNKCSSKITNDKNRHSHDDFIKAFYNLKTDIKILSEYVDAKTKILCKCVTCNNIWYVTPNKLLQGRGCPKCAIEHRNLSKVIPKNDFIERLSNVNKDIILFDGYEGVSKKAVFLCKIHNELFEAIPQNLLAGHGCPICANERQRRTHEEFMLKLHNQNDNDITILSQYTGITDDITVKCNICNHMWVTTPHSLYKNSGCPLCNSSLGELRTRKYLLDNNLNFIWQKEFDGLTGIGNGLLSYDFYLQDYNLLIEYQGEFHDGTAKQQTLEQFEYQKEHDRRKKQYAIDNNIKLLEIWYWNYENIEEILDKELELSSSFPI